MALIGCEGNKIRFITIWGLKLKQPQIESPLGQSRVKLQTNFDIIKELSPVYENNEKSLRHEALSTFSQ